VAISNKPNVVIIILESFSNEYIGYFNKGESYTPFLDSLFQQSHLFVRAYANGKRSIEGIPSVIAGMPSLSETPYISSNYSSNKIDALGSILKNKGYITSFFHGGHNGTMGFEYFTKIAGYDNYYGLNEFSGNEEDYDSKWGVFDKPFLLFSAKEISNYAKPFVASIFTLSSHHPFLLPKSYLYKGPKKIKHPILRTIKYTDDALKSFFEYAQKQAWFKNTLFVITADHTGPDLSKKASTMAGIFQIPIAYYMPDKIKPKVDYRVTQQIDIMPTILHYLGYNSKFYAFGNSMRDSLEKGFAINYCLNTYQLFSDSLLYHYFNDESLRLLKPYSDTMLIQNWNKDYEIITKQMERKTKAIIQTYNNALIKNKTYANP
jgi:phosphoglycerol transferase MdoB-like AlkP superfamily enzyme